MARLDDGTGAGRGFGPPGSAGAPNMSLVDVPHLLARDGADPSAFVLTSACWKGTAGGAPTVFRSNIPSRLNLPFVGRDTHLAKLRETLDDVTCEAVVVLSGPPGTGKSELAREYARHHRTRYPSGTFFVDMSSPGPPIMLAQIGKDILGLAYGPDLPLEDQCMQALMALAAGPSLLVYDNVLDVDAVIPWLPPSGMPCHVLVTSWLDTWDLRWQVLPVEPLDDVAVRDLVEALVGQALAARHGAEIAARAGGLPVQILPSASAVGLATRRGRPVAIGVAAESESSFRRPYELLGPDAQLVLHAAVFLNTQRIDLDELFGHLDEPTGWSRTVFDQAVDSARDLHLLEGGPDIRMHQLIADFVLGVKFSAEMTERLGKVRMQQVGRLLEIAAELGGHPNDDQATLLL